MKTSDKLIERINRDLPQVPIAKGSKLYSYRGPKDAGQFSWTNGGYPEVCSCDSMTTLLKAKSISTTEPWQYRSNGWEIGVGK